jgi:fibro-slime domain-containing protein/uncharacterized repeat protein (TIGR01451 family)
MKGEKKVKKKVLFPLLALVLALGLWIPMAAPVAANGPTINLPVTIRDFHSAGWGGVDGYSGHPDFEASVTYGIDAGIVDTTLGLDDKPVYDGPGSLVSTTGEAEFDQWYNDTANVNMPLDTTLAFTWDGTKYVYSNSSFFPIDGALLGNETYEHNYHFTMELHHSFTYQGGEVFNFTGDDDLWLFINKQLVIDLGGVHAAESASVDLDTLVLEVGENYDFDLFFAERHTTASNFVAETTIELANPSLEITKEADREYAYEGDTINYLYRVHNDGNVPLSPVVVTDSLPITVTPVMPGGGPHNRGDLNQNGQLDPCETWYFTASYTVPDPCDRPAIVNIATAVAGTGLESPTRVRDQSDRVRVIILHPCIELEKWTVEEPPAYYNGTEITYYYGLHNCGDTPLEILVVRDTTLGEDAIEVLGRDGEHNRGDLNNNGVFEPCETWYFSLDHTLVCRGITYSDFCNSAMAGAFEPILESRVVVRDVTWKVRIFQWLPRTIGFWANWDNHIAVGDMRQLVADVDEQSTYFGLADPGPTAGGAVRNLLERIKGKMNADKAERMLAKQLLAAWLSVKSYENYGSYGDLNWAMNPNATVYIDTDGDGVPDTADGTVKELLYRIEGAIGSMDKDGLLLAKDILEAMNSAESNHYVMFMDPSFDPTSPCP